MIEKVELTRKKVYGTDPLKDPRIYGPHDTYALYKNIEPYEYTLRFGENYARVVEDMHMIDMRMSLPAAEYNRYLVDRLTTQMLHHLGGGIKKALDAQAAANAPASDNMAYLFSK